MTAKKAVRMTASGRREFILTVAMRMAIAQGLNSLSAREIGDAAKCAHGLVFHYFGDMDGLRTDMMHRAVDDNNAELLLQGLMCKHPIALAAPEELKAQARTFLS